MEPTRSPTKLGGLLKSCSRKRDSTLAAQEERRDLAAKQVFLGLKDETYRPISRHTPAAIASAASTSPVWAKLMWTNDNTPPAISQMANRSMPIFLVPIHFIDLHLYYRMAKQGNNALRAGMCAALKRRMRSRRGFVVLLACLFYMRLHPAGQA